MAGLKKLGIFVLILALLGCGTALLFWDIGADCLSVLRTGTGRAEYLLAASDAEGGIYALGRTDRGYQLVVGDQTGRRTGVWRLTAEGLPEESTPALLYPAAGGAVYLGLYNTEEETRLELYRITQEGAAAELLLSEPCPGGNLQEQMSALTLSSFSQVDSVVTFALLRGDTAEFYQRTSASSGLEQIESVEQPGLRAALACPTALWCWPPGTV